MHYLTLPYGQEGWDERTRIVERIIAEKSQAPFIYNDVLVLVPSLRRKRTYGRLFLDALQKIHNAHALVQPEIQTLHHFFGKLYALTNGPTVIDENSRLVLLEGIVKEQLAAERVFDQSPDLLAPSLSAALAKTIEQLSAAGIGPHDLSAALVGADFIEKRQVRLLVAVYRRFHERLDQHRLTDPSGMLQHLLKNFNPSWLDGYREIIIDDMQHVGKWEVELLKKICTFSRGTFLIEAPSLELLQQAREFHPLTLLKELVASIGIAPGPNPLHADADDLFLAASVFSEKTFEEIEKAAPVSFKKEVRILSAVNTREELSLIAGMVKTSVRNGVPADSILVAFPGLDAYGPLVEEIFSDYGVPYNRALGRQLSTSPVTTAIVSLLRCAQEDFSGPSLLRIFSSPFLKFADFPTLASRLEWFMREHRIIGGREKLMGALKRHREDEAAELLSTHLEDLFNALDPFRTKESASLKTWMERVAMLIAWCGIDARANDLHGPLNINLQAYAKLKDTLRSLARSGTLFPAYSYTFHEWFFLLKKTLMHTRFQVPPEDEGGVQILGLEESSGRPWKEIYLGGLVDGKFPQHLPQNIFLPAPTLKRLGVATPERNRMNAASHFYRLLLSANKVTLTWPENDAERPMVPSPFLEEFTPLKKIGMVNRGIQKTEHIQFSFSISESCSIPELAKALSLMSYTARSKGVPFKTEWLTGLSKLAPIAAIQAALGQAAATSPQNRKHEKRIFRVTELDDYIKCPYDYYVKHVLGIGPLEEVSEDISSLDRGGRVHVVLKNFYRTWTKPITSENRSDARKLLCELADSAFAGLADTVRNRREKDLFINRMLQRFLDAEELFWRQGFKPHYLEQTIESFKLLLSNGEEAELTAKIDRIDVDASGNFIIVDYKTGRYPLPKMGLEQDIFQLPVYAVLASASLKNQAPALKEVVGLAYYDLGGKIGGTTRDTVLFNKELLDDQPSSKPKSSSKSAAEFHTIVNNSIEKAKRAIEGIVAGDYPAAPDQENNCRYCVNAVLCENHHGEK